MDKSRDTLLYTSEHLNCFLYNSADPIIGLYNVDCGGRFPNDHNQNRILFLLKGKINFVYGDISIILEKDSFMLLSNSYIYDITVVEDASFVFINLHLSINFCDHYPLGTLFKSLKNQKTIPIFSPLKFNNVLSIFIKNIASILADGLRCTYLLEKKQQEMLYYLRAYYPKDELALFFAPMYNYDVKFAELIYKHYESAKTIENLANISNYSISGFKKRFVKVFGMPPHQWIEKEKAKKIYHEINCTTDSFKEISTKYDFVSPSHFDKFCKKMYNMSPGALRTHTACSILGNDNPYCVVI
jgi:AraC-like DNA-binding protein